MRTMKRSSTSLSSNSNANGQPVNWLTWLTFYQEVHSWSNQLATQRKKKKADINWQKFQSHLHPKQHHPFIQFQTKQRLSQSLFKSLITKGDTSFEKYQIYKVQKDIFPPPSPILRK